MNKTNFFVAVLLTLLSIINTVYAEEQPVAQLKNFLSTSKSFSADFKQVLINELGNPVQTSYGVFYLQRPGKFRWNYAKPFQQEIVSTGGKVWFYDVDLEQVTIKNLDNSVGSTPALLLSGQVSLEDNFTMEEQGVEGDMQWIRLVPKKPEGSFKYVTIGLEKGKLAGMELMDNFGQLTRIYFSKILLNPPLKPTLFDFTPPKGVDVFTEGK
jgi:outer membrane lipoprotein carrier protein